MLTRLFNRVAYSERGASMVEYSLLVVLIALAALVAVRFLGTALDDTYSQIGDELVNANNP